MKQELNEVASAPKSGYADWHYSAHGSINIWSWSPVTGVCYRITQDIKRKIIEAHITRGVSYKMTTTIDSYATVQEAKRRCEEHATHK